MIDQSYPMYETGSLEIRVQRIGDAGTLLVTIEGDAGMANCEQLHRELAVVCARRPALAVVDLSGVTFIGSVAMGALLTLRRTVTNHGGQIRLTGVPPTIMDALRRARLDVVFGLPPRSDAELAEASSAS